MNDEWRTMRHPVTGSEFSPCGNVTPIEDLMALYELAKSLPYGGLAIEVGSYVGMSALAFCSAGLTVLCVDSLCGLEKDRPSVRGPHQAEVFHRNTENYPAGLLCGESTFWAGRMCSAGVSAHLVFIDACHDRESVRSDILAWLPVLREDGILVMHDVGFFDGVVQAMVDVFPDCKSVFHAGRKDGHTTVAWARKCDLKRVNSG